VYSVASGDDVVWVIVGVLELDMLDSEGLGALLEVETPVKVSVRPGDRGVVSKEIDSEVSWDDKDWLEKSSEGVRDVEEIDASVEDTTDGLTFIEDSVGLSVSKLETDWKVAVSDVVGKVT
jgi:hypothetical protein